MVGKIILGELPFKAYTGKRFAYEWDCCWLGWSLLQLNPTLLEQKGLLQRATENVASFLFEGCMSRNKLKSRRAEISKSGNSKLALHLWEQHMIPCPDWLPALKSDQCIKDRLKNLYKETIDEYYSHVAKQHCENMEAVVKNASRHAIEFYSQRTIGDF